MKAERNVYILYVYAALSSIFRHLKYPPTAESSPLATKEVKNVFFYQHVDVATRKFVTFLFS